MEEAERTFNQQSPEKMTAVRVLHDFSYQTLDSWTRTRRVAGKAEHTAAGPNPRFVVTSLKKERFTAQPLYEELYCARGDMENRLKEQQLGMFSDRTSTATLRANQLRLFFSSVAYVLVNLLRKHVLVGTSLEKAQVGTLRLKLFKIGALVRVSVRRVFVQMSSAYPGQALFHTIHQRLMALRPATA